MEYSTVGLGIFIVLYGIYTIIQTISSPEKLIKLTFMKNKLGFKTGVFLHTVVYVVVPVIFGVFLINAGLNGVTITQFWVR